MKCKVCGKLALLGGDYCERCWDKYDAKKDSLDTYNIGVVNPVSELMTRQNLSTFIAEKCDKIKDLFNYKNQDYGQDADAFANFRKTAQRVIMPLMPNISEHDAMFAVLMVYMDKHLVALSQTGLGGNEVDERLGDVANYALIARGILADKNRGVK